MDLQKLKRKTQKLASKVPKQQLLHSDPVLLDATKYKHFSLPGTGSLAKQGNANFKTIRHAILLCTLLKREVLNASFELQWSGKGKYLFIPENDGYRDNKPHYQVTVKKQ